MHPQTFGANREVPEARTHGRRRLVAKGGPWRGTERRSSKKKKRKRVSGGREVAGVEEKGRGHCEETDGTRGEGTWRTVKDMAAVTSEVATAICTLAAHTTFLTRCTMKREAHGVHGVSVKKKHSKNWSQVRTHPGPAS